MPLLLSGNTVIGNTAPNVYSDYKPWCHASGVPRWIVDNADYTHTLEGHHLRLRTQAELEADPAYQAWQAAQAIDQAAANAPAVMATIPNWLKTYTVDDVAAYIAANVTNLDTAKIALTHLGKAIIVMRDYIKLHP